MGLIYLDSCLVIYLVERHPRWGELVAAAMAGEAGARFGISALVKCECLVAPIRRADPVLQSAYSGLFERLVTLDMPETIYIRAAELRARSGLRTPDALHLACAQYHRCDALWTNDDRLAQASFGMARCVLTG